MQPDTAFWALSTIAQSAAALAGLTALLLVFVLTQAVQRLKAIDPGVGIYDYLHRFPISQALVVGTLSYLGSVVVALIFIGRVVPGADAVGPDVALAWAGALALLVVGSLALAWFILNPGRWFESREDRQHKRETKRRLKKEGRWPP